MERQQRPSDHDVICYLDAAHDGDGHAVRMLEAEIKRARNSEHVMAKYLALSWLVWSVLFGVAMMAGGGQ